MADLTSSDAKPAKPAIWPLVIAPIVGAVYYLFLRDAFSVSITGVLGLEATKDIDLEDLAGPHWGSHWFYRLIAEFLCISFAALIAAGIARGREILAAILSITLISLFFLIRVGVILYFEIFEAGSYLLTEPWYQYFVDALIIFAAPIIGFKTAELAQQINKEESQGFAGINRWHFLWLWIACYAYAVGLISNIARFEMLQIGTGVIGAILSLIIYGIPAAVLLVPAYYGLALLSNHKGKSLRPLTRNILGTAVLVLGFFPGFLFGLSIQYDWAKLYSALFG